MRWEDIKFSDFFEFYRDRKILRYYYRRLPIDEKWAYKRFVYGNELNEKEIDRDCIWNYLNENENCKKEIIARMEYRKKYRR